MLSKLCRLRQRLGDALDGIVTVQITAMAGAVPLNSSADKPKGQTDVVKEVTKPSQEKKQEVRVMHLPLRRNQSNTSVAGIPQTSERQSD